MPKPTSSRAEKRVAEIHLLQNIADPEDGNVDVVVQLSDGEQRTVTLFTPKNIASLMRSYAETGECLGGRYFWAIEMVLVEKLTPEVIGETIEDMVRSGEYELAFGRVTPVSDGFETESPPAS